jgi:hypothetical protein
MREAVRKPVLHEPVRQRVTALETERVERLLTARSRRGTDLGERPGSGGNEPPLVFSVTQEVQGRGGTLCERLRQRPQPAGAKCEHQKRHET